MLPNFFFSLFYCCSHLSFLASIIGLVPNAPISEKEFISLPQFLPKKKYDIYQWENFLFICPDKKIFSIVSPLISSFSSPPFVLHALLSFRSFHFYPQMTFYVPSVAFISYIITISHTYERKLVGWSLLIRLENGFGRIWMKLLWMGFEWWLLWMLWRMFVCLWVKMKLVFLEFCMKLWFGVSTVWTLILGHLWMTSIKKFWFFRPAQTQEVCKLYIKIILFMWS